MQKKFFALSLAVILILSLVIAGCGGGNSGGGTGGDTVINIAAIPGVTPPAYGETPVTAITETAQYTGTVSWSPSGSPFAATTVYTATITLTAKSGYTLTGVAANFFTVAGATSDTNSVDSGVVTAVFPATGSAPPTVINIAAISGVAAPIIGVTPVTTITETDQYTGTVTWDGGWAWSSRFCGDKAYTATITLTAKPGYTLTGVTANYFTVAGVTSVTNSAGSGVVTAVFPKTASVAVGDSVLGGKVAYILQAGDTGYVAGEQRGLIAAGADQSTSSIIWAVAAYQALSIPNGTSRLLGTGSSNTHNIIVQNEAGTTYAAGLAHACTDGSYTDWYLPSMEEMAKLYINRAAIGGFTVPGGYYWSSSEYDNGNAYQYLFNNPGSEGGMVFAKGGGGRVRAVRSF